MLAKLKADTAEVGSTQNKSKDKWMVHVPPLRSSVLDLEASRAIGVPIR